MKLHYSVLGWTDPAGVLGDQVEVTLIIQANARP